MSDKVEYQNDVFISYHPANQAWVQNVLLPRLEAAELKVVVDYRDFQIGVPKVVNIERAVDTSRHTLAVITSDWLEKGWGEFEGVLVQTADSAGRYRRLIPLLLKPSRLPTRLAQLTYADFTGSDRQNEVEMHRLLRGLLTKSRVFLSFKHDVQPDQSLALYLCEVLEREGHQMYTDRDVTVGMTYRDGVRQKIEQSDHMVALISAAAVADDVIVDQIEHAHLLSSRKGKARILPVRVDYTEALPDRIREYMKDLGYALWRADDDNERVTRRLLDAMSTFAALSVRNPKKLTPEELASQSKLWPNGSVVPIAFLDGDAALQWMVAKVASEWTRYANLRFVFGDVSEAAVRVSFKQSRSSWSQIGTDALAISKDQPTINFGWLTANSPKEEVRRVVLHEFGHVLGLVHEHQLAAAQIPWDKEAVYRALSGPPNHWTKQDVDVAMFQRYSPDYFPIEKEFDPKSIMMFSMPKEWTNGDDFLDGLRMDLSDKDKEFVQRLYPRA